VEEIETPKQKERREERNCGDGLKSKKEEWTPFVLCVSSVPQQFSNQTDG
jgi:hypothetical protein